MIGRSEKAGVGRLGFRRAHGRSAGLRTRRVVIEPLEDRMLLDVGGALSGLVYEDLNLNGQQDPDEGGLADWSVQAQQVGGLAQAVMPLRNPVIAGEPHMGLSVALAGNLIALGAPYDDAVAPDAGAVYLYDAQTGAPVRTITSPTGARGDAFGFSMAAFGDDVLVGAPAPEWAGGAAVGRAYLVDGQTGQVLTTFLNPTPANGDYFGYKVAALDADRVLISAHCDDTGATDTGAAYLFNAYTGQLLRTFLNPTPQAGDRFGESIAVIGDKVLVRAVLDNLPTTQSGTIYVYDPNTGALLRTIYNPTPGQYDQFGVMAPGPSGTLLASAWLDDDDGTDTGKAYKIDVDTGQVLTTFRNPTPAASDLFGYSLAALGEYVVVGAMQDDAFGADAGTAYLFDGRTGELLQTLGSPEATPGDIFGNQVMAVGDLVLATAPGADIGASKTGVGYLFDVGTQRTTTGPDGAYELAGLAAGNYRLRQVPPAGHVQTQPPANNPYNVSLAEGQSVSGLDFGVRVNHVPVAQDDNYVVLPNTPLVVPAAGGLLANDLDEDGDPLAIEITDWPDYGTLQLSPDGGFTYTPLPGSRLVDSFAYRASDGATTSKTARVTLFYRASGPGSATGTVYEDLDLDGQRDAGEGGMAGWTVQAQRVGGSSEAVMRLRNPVVGGEPHMGLSVALAGNLIALGAPYDDAVAPEAGAVYLYDAQTGALVRTVTNPAGARGDIFGYSVAAFGDDFLVGAPAPDWAGAAAPGRAYLVDGQTGQVLTTFLNPTPANADYFGYKVAVLDADRVVISAPCDDALRSDSGAVHLFNVHTGQVLRTILNPTPQAGDRFGDAIAVVGGKVVVRAVLDNTPRTQSGTVYVYNPDTGALLRTITNPTPGYYDQFGVVAPGPNGTLLASAWLDDDDGTDTGKAYMIDINTGQVLRTFRNPTPNVSDWFGYSLAALGDYVLIGATQDDAFGTDAGTVYLFDSRTGELLQTLGDPEATPGDVFGSSVMAVGDLVLATAPGADFGASKTGVGYLFDVGIRRTTTGPDGAYELAGLTAGNYRVWEVPPAGHVQTQPPANGLYNVTVAEGQSVSGLDFGVRISHAPVANDESYAVEQNTALAVPAATGLLANDVDQDGDPLVVEMVDWPDYGTLQVSPDGSFTYTPSLTSTYVDWFAYRAKDPVAKSQPAIVTLMVNPPRQSAAAGTVYEDIDADAQRDPLEAGLPGWTVQTQRAGGLADAVVRLRNPAPNTGDNMGSSGLRVGNFVALGAPRDSTVASGAGAVYLFDAQTGALVRTILNPVVDAGAQFGESLAVFGDDLLVGAPTADYAGVGGSGAAYLIDVDTGQLLMSFGNPTPAVNEYFGYRMTAVDADRVLISAHYANDAGPSECGAAYIFDAHSGALLRSLLNPFPDSGDRFGESVAVVQGKLLIRAPHESTPVYQSGVIYVYDPDTGTRLGTIQNPSPNSDDRFGEMAPGPNGTLLASAFRDDDDGYDTGKAYMIDVNTGQVLRTFRNPAPAPGDWFGTSLAAMGDNVLISADMDGANGTEAGIAYLFVGNTGELLQTFVAPTDASGSRLGRAIFPVGDRVVVTSALADLRTWSGVVTDCGAAYVFDVGIARTTSGTDGAYELAGLKAGTYRVGQTPQPGYLPTQPVAGRYVATLPAGQTVTGLDFGNYRNYPPEVELGPDLTTPEGTGIVLMGSFTDPNPQDLWTATVDYGDGAGPQPLDLNPDHTFVLGHVYPDDGEFVVQVSVAEDQGGTGTDTMTVRVLNVAPQLAGVTAGPEFAVDGRVTVQGGIVDPGVLDTFLVCIDWGDGTVDELPYAAGTASFVAEHVYQTGGVYAIGLLLADDDGGQDEAAVQALVTGASLQGGVLTVVGTPAADDVKVARLDGLLRVSAAFLPGPDATFVVPVAGVTRIDVLLGDGNDKAEVANSVTTSVKIDGGRGNDTLSGGSGNDLLLGGDGDDWLQGGNGLDLLFAGLGADVLLANGDSDLLIAGWTLYDNDAVALDAILAEWTSGRPYATRVENLRGTNPDPVDFALRLNGDFFLRGEGANRTVWEDHVSDMLVGAAGLDWYFAHLDDPQEERSDRIAGSLNDEIVDQIAPV